MPSETSGRAPRAERHSGKERRHRYWGSVARQKREILNVHAQQARRVTAFGRALRAASRFMATAPFLAAEIAFHAGWILLNTGVVRGVTPWDPPPFDTLLGLASLQALFIGLLILGYEERQADTDDVRAETELQVALHSEREATKALELLLEIRQALGLPDDPDHELEIMTKPLDPQSLAEDVREEIEEATDEDGTRAD